MWSVEIFGWDWGHVAARLGAARGLGSAHESLFNHKGLRVGICPFDQTEPFEDFLDVRVEGKAAADHRAIGVR